MKKLALIITSVALVASHASSVFANPNMDERQKLIQEQMELLGSAQNMMQLEIQSHFKRSQTIQNYQMCIQAGSKKDDFRICKMRLKKDQKMLDEEVAALRKLNR